MEINSKSEEEYYCSVNENLSSDTPTPSNRRLNSEGSFSSDGISGTSEPDSGIICDTEYRDIVFTDNSSTSRHNVCRCRRYSLDDSGLGWDLQSTTPIMRRRRSLQTTPYRIYEPSNVRRRSLQVDRLASEEESLQDPHRVGMGSNLFLAFLHEELNRSELQAPEDFQRNDFSSARNTENVCEFLSIGSHLRQMADEFASSDHRRRVKERAESVPLRSLDMDSFIDLVLGVFQQGGVTCERVLVLFVFCADLAVRALREKLVARFVNVMQWSQFYIESRLAPWVQRHGGWTAVLHHSVHEAYKAAAVGACVMGMVALWMYIRSSHH